MKTSTPETATAWLARESSYRIGDKGPQWHGRITLGGFRCAARLDKRRDHALLEIELLAEPKRGLTRTFSARLAPASGPQWSGRMDALGREWTVTIEGRLPRGDDIPDDPRAREWFRLTELCLTTDGTGAEWAPEAARAVSPESAESPAAWLSYLSAD